MKRRLSFWVMALLLLVACGRTGQPAMQKLALIDSLLNQEQVDSAWHEVQRFDTVAMTDAVRAYYQLLRVQAMWKAYVPVPSDSLLDFSLAFYQEHGPHSLLARTYYYKGAVLKEQGGTTEAVDHLKRAEQLARQADDVLLLSKVCNSLEDVNFAAGDYATALRYAREAVDCCLQLDNPKLLLQDYEALAVAFHHAGQRDSALYYFEQCMPLISSVRREEQAHVLANLGIYYKNLGSVQKAEQLLRQSVDIEPHGFAYRSLANLYADRGDVRKAEQYYLKALDVAERTDTRISTLQSYRELKMQMGDYRQANELATQVNALKDSLQQRRSVENVGVRQQQFDRSAERTLLDGSRWRAWLWAGGLLAALLLGGGLSVLRKRQADSRLLSLQRQMADNVKAIDDVRREAQQATRQMESMEADNRKMQGRLAYANMRLKELEQSQKETLEKMKKSYAEQLSHGSVLYEQFMAGCSTRSWYKHDYQDFEIYYCMRDIPFSVVLQENYADLSPQQRFSLIMSHLGHSDDHIREVMGLSDAAWRTMQSRMKKKINTVGEV